MGFQGIDYICLCVESLRQAENFYTRLFGLQVLCREAQEAGAGNPPQKEAETTASQSSLLGCAGFRLALCRRIEEFTGPGRVDHICLRADMPEIARLRRQAEEMGCLLLNDGADTLSFVDLYGVRWKVATPETGAI
jgi:catechol 2,3-dioxygenase-like lactoylglutathione lyase family enzyme